jgi:hypothetical protein
MEKAKQILAVVSSTDSRSEFCVFQLIAKVSTSRIGGGNDIELMVISI